MPYLRVSGATLFYAVHSTREPNPLPVVFIHGAGGNHLAWPPVFRQLSPLVITYLPDLPGHGRSAGHGFDSVDEYADAILQFCHLLALTDVVLVGHSMGGAIALTVDLHQPGLCRGLVLLNSAAKFTVPHTILTALEQDHEQAIDLICEYAFGPESAYLPEPLQAWWEQATRRMLRDLPLETLRKDYLACQSFDVVTQLGNIRTPALIVGATDDALTPLNDQFALSQRLPRSTLVVIQGASHAAVLSHAEQIRERILSFLELTKRPGGGKISKATI